MKVTDGIPALCVGPDPLTSVALGVDIITPRDGLPASPVWVKTDLQRIKSYNISNKDGGRLEINSLDTREIFALNTDVIANFRGTLVTCEANDLPVVYRPELICGKRADNSDEVWVVVNAGDITPSVLCCPD